MFDLDWSKLALIAVVALVVIGPKDLPRVMRILGQWMQRARAIARDFQGSLDQMVREAELEEVKRTVDKAANFDVEHEIGQTIDPRGDLQRSLNDPVLSNPLTEAPKLLAEETPDAVAGAAGSAPPVEAQPTQPPPASSETEATKPMATAAESETHRS